MQKRMFFFSLVAAVWIAVCPVAKASELASESLLKDRAAEFINSDLNEYSANQLAYDITRNADGDSIISNLNIVLEEISKNQNTSDEFKQAAFTALQKALNDQMSYRRSETEATTYSVSLVSGTFVALSSYFLVPDVAMPLMENMFGDGPSMSIVQVVDVMMRVAVGMASGYGVAKLLSYANVFMSAARRTEELMTSKVQRSCKQLILSTIQ